jgi:antimicrobial peptide system SdpA family protein
MKKRIYLLFRYFAYLSPPAILVVIVFFIVVCSMPPSAYRPDFRISAAVEAFMPEGWSFFTRSPREEMADLYSVEGDTVYRFTSTNGAPSNFFGLSRKSRKVGMDLSFLAESIPDSAWETVSMLTASTPFKKIFKCKPNRRITSIPRGRYIIAAYKPIPWAWRNTYSASQRNYRVILIDYEGDSSLSSTNR